MSLLFLVVLVSIALVLVTGRARVTLCYSAFYTAPPRLSHRKPQASDCINVFFSAPARPAGVAYALLRHLTSAEALHATAATCMLHALFSVRSVFSQVPEERQVQPHLVRAGCYVTTMPSFCGPCFL